MSPAVRALWRKLQTHHAVSDKREGPQEALVQAAVCVRAANASDDERQAAYQAREAVSFLVRYLEQSFCAHYPACIEQACPRCKSRNVRDFQPWEPFPTLTTGKGQSDGTLRGTGDLTVRKVCNVCRLVFDQLRGAP